MIRLSGFRAAVLFSALFMLVSTPSALAQELSERTGTAILSLISESSSLLDEPTPVKTVEVKSASVASNSDTPRPSDDGIEMVVNARAYCLRGRTASGRYTKHGIIAVDPRVIPMGSRIYVPGYGWGVAADTGGMIIGRAIDLWMPTANECYQWGRRNVRIKVYPRK